MLYPLSPGPAGLDADDPVMGYAISFPRIGTEEKVEYAVNAVFHREFETEFDEVDPDEEALSRQ